MGSLGTLGNVVDPNIPIQCMASNVDRPIDMERLVGSEVDTVAYIDGIQVLALLDTGSMVTTVSKQFLKTYFPALPVFPMEGILQVKGPLDENLPYEGIVELELSFPVGKDVHFVGTFPVLVAPQTSYNSKLPLLVGLVSFL